MEMPMLEEKMELDAASDVVYVKTMPGNVSSRRSSLGFSYRMPYHRSDKRTLLEERYGLRFGQWETGLFSCFSNCVPNGLTSTLCPCVAIAQITARLGIIHYSSALLATFTLVMIQAVALGFALTEWHQHATHAQSHSEEEHQVYMIAFHVLNKFVYAMGILAAWLLRVTTRRRFEIPGSCCGDLVATFCCYYCVTAQMGAHLKSYRPGCCDFRAVEVLPAFPRE